MFNVKIKKFKWYLFVIIFFAMTIFVPVTLSKYKESFTKKITLNIRKPEYNLVFNELLPSEYQEVEYIETNGTQYIDTNYYLASENISVQTKIFVKEMLNSEQVIISNQNDNNQHFILGVNKENNNYHIFNDNMKIDTDISYIIDINTKYDNKNKFKTFIVNNKKNIKEYNSKITNSNSTLKLFKGNDNENLFNGRIYYLTIFEDDKLKFSFVPCYRKSDNVIGLYDMVNNIFYINSGSDTFSKGSDISNSYHPFKSQYFVYGIEQNINANTFVKNNYTFANWNTNSNGTGLKYEDKQLVNKLSSSDGDMFNLYSQWMINEYDVLYNQILPDEYQEVEYIHTTGTQYIDTNQYLNSNNLNIKMKMFVDEFSNAEQNIISNQDDDSGNSNTGKFIMAISNILGSYRLFGYSENDSNVTLKMTDVSEIIDVELDYDWDNQIKTLIVNGEKTTGTQYAKIANTTSTIKLFKSGFKDSLYFKGKIYSLTMYEHDELKFNFVPCYRKSDNVIGMYDMISNTFYSNSGSGAFLKGNDISNAYHLVDRQHYIINEEKNLISNTYSRDGYEFAGWNTESDGNGILYSNEELVKNLSGENEYINLYPQWEKIEQ